MIVKLLTERHLEFLSLKGGCTGSSESTLVKMSNCWKSHALAQYLIKPSISITRILPCIKADQDIMYYCAKAQTKSRKP